MGAILAALFADTEQCAEQPMPLASLPPELLKQDPKDRRKEVDIVRELLQDEPDKLKAYNLYVEAGYSPKTCRNLVFTPQGN